MLIFSLRKLLFVLFSSSLQISLDFHNRTVRLFTQVYLDLKLTWQAVTRYNKSSACFAVVVNYRSISQLYIMCIHLDSDIAVSTSLLLLFSTQGGGDVGKYTCLLCQKEFNSESGVKYHISKTHSQVNQTHSPCLLYV